MSKLEDCKHCGFICASRKGNNHAGEQQDCDWPVCGCDPHAGKVIEDLLESGWMGTKEARELRERTSIAEGVQERMAENAILRNEELADLQRRYDDLHDRLQVDYIRRLQVVEAESAQYKSSLDMYANAWRRELGLELRHKHHEIDALVVSTRDIKRQRDALRESHGELLAALQWVRKSVLQSCSCSIKLKPPICGFCLIEAAIKKAEEISK